MPSRAVHFAVALEMDKAPAKLRQCKKAAKGWNEMKVSDLLKGQERPVLTVKPNETIGLLARLLQQHRVGVMVVSHDGRTPEGIISERDIAYSLAERRGELHLLPVSALMTADWV